MIQQCRDVGLRAAVEGRQVALTLRDSATIMQLFGMQPATVNVYRGRPDGDDRLVNVRVEYVDPRIPVPDSAFRAEAARRHRQYEASVNSVQRWIGAEDEFGESTILIETGDSTVLTLNELHCHFDVCGGSAVSVGDSSWTVNDTTIAVLRTPRPRSVVGMTVFGSNWPYLVGRRAGTTLVRLHGLQLPSDTMPSRNPVSSTLQREVRVLPTLARIEIVPRPASVRRGDRVEFRTRVIDRAGQEVTGVPVSWRINATTYSELGVQSLPRSVVFDSTGSRTIVARVGRRIDSLTVVVVTARRH
jgi:hypothetical protein